MTATVAVGLIDLYQQYISPHKGFRCAHRAKHGRSSCSQFAKRLIQKVGLLRFWPILMRRFDKCGKAAHALKSRVGARKSFSRDDPHQNDKNKSNRGNSIWDGCDPSGGCDVASGCDVPDLTGACDGAHACDAGGCDAGGCDFSV